MQIWLNLSSKGVRQLCVGFAHRIEVECVSSQVQRIDTAIPMFVMILQLYSFLELYIF